MAKVTTRHSPSDMTELNTVERQLLALVARALFGAQSDNLPQKLNVRETQALFAEARRQAVSAIALDGFENPTEVMDEQLYKNWVAVSRAVISSTDRVFRSHAFLDKLLSDAGIPYVILKGCASACSYPKPYLRIMGDVDFLVSEQDKPKAMELLERHGWKPHSESGHHICHIAYYKEGADRFELHFNPPGIPYDTAAEQPVREFFSDIFDTAVSLTQDGVTFRAPDVLHQFFVLLLHIQHHLVGTGIGLRHLCDLAVFYAAHVNAPFWENRLVPRLRAFGLYPLACTLLGAAQKYLGMPDGGVAFETDENLKDLMIYDIINGGNFGNKNTSRAQAQFFIADASRPVASRGIVSQSFFTLLHISNMRYPVTKRFPPLLVFTMPYDVARYFVRVLTGKRIFLGNKELAYAKERKGFYTQLHMFEPEV